MNQPWYELPLSKYDNKDVTIIGGGVAGTSIAYSLFQRGWKINLIDKNNNLASGASGNTAGIISPLLTHKSDVIGKFFLNGFKYSLKHLEYLQKLNTNILQNLCGLLEFSKLKVNKSIEELVVGNNLIEKLTNAQASEICMQDIKSKALFIKSAGWISPKGLCEANISLCNDNLNLILNKEVTELLKVNNKWIAKGKRGSVLTKSDVVIIANANDAKKFEQTNWLPLTPVRGQISYVESDEIFTNKVLCYDGGYITPKINGINYVGATFDKKNISTNVKAEDDYVNLSNLRNLLGGGLCKVVGSRAALRATSPDRRPIIGCVPNNEKFLSDYKDIKHGKANTKYPNAKHHDGLYVSTGFGSRGLTGAPIAGEILACIINNEPLPVEKEIVNAVNPARFIIRQLKKS
jgi:tRNA 5-methylaminomethyl-2-thiouridine biosynthesis bifunctional protein